MCVAINLADTVTRPDKGRGVVILNKTDYIRKMNNILSDRTKFQLLETHNQVSYTLKIEDKVNRHPMKLLDNKIISHHHSLYCSGTQPGIMYGLPKIHQPDTPLRPNPSSL